MHQSWSESCKLTCRNPSPGFQIEQSAPSRPSVGLSSWGWPRAKPPDVAEPGVTGTATGVTKGPSKRSSFTGIGFTLKVKVRKHV